ncbi:MAG: class F sortase [Candidatus Paceibacterota bacterium]|jgi:LPXTG-site transpeptidase (sortase) family protein
MSTLSKVKDFAAGVITIISMVVFTLALFYVIHISQTDASSTLNINNNQSEEPVLVPVVKETKNTAKSASPVKKQSVPKNYPATLSIPGISVNAKVQHVGVTSKGNMAVPSNYSDVGWYRNGTIPGELGTAVFDGHLNNSLGIPAVFGKLSQVSIGDEITVKTHGGKTLNFVVTDIAVYDYDDPKAAEAIFAHEGKSLIRLITCDGSWLSDKKTYGKRLVVTAEFAD